MIYSEFLDLTNYNETYITHSDYTDYIEPVYMGCDLHKQIFCKKFKQKFKKAVQIPVSLMIKGKTSEDKIRFINGDESVFDDVNQAEKLLKQGFFKGGVFI